MTAIAASLDADQALEEFQGQLHLVFARARTVWKEAATQIHPELSPAGYKLLSFIARTGSANAHQLSEAFEMDKSVVSRLVRTLEDLGLLQSRPDEHDGRQRVLTATPEAVAALAGVRAELNERMRAVLTRLAPDELRSASHVFQALTEV